MNVKHSHTGAAVLFFVFIFAGGVFFDVRAQEDGAPQPFGECPELDQLKKRSAQIGGNAWNYHALWIYNRFVGIDQQGNSQNYGVHKKREETGISTGRELEGWSYSQRFGHICWGATCASEGEGNLQACDGTPHCTKPSHASPVYDVLDRQTFLNGRDDSFAEIDFEGREKICHERDVQGNPRYSPDPLTGRDEPVVKPCDEIPENQRGPAPTYCLYPLKGWMKIRALRNEGWVRLSGRIVGTTVPQELRDADGRVVNPGTFGEWENWKRNGQHLNCSDDDVFRANIKACSYRVVYDPSKKEFYGWAWNPLLEWIAFSGSTLFDTRAWKNKNWCDGPSCTEVSYDVQNKRSRWNTAYLGVWVRGLGGSFFARKGFSGINPPPGEFNTDYVLVTGRFAPDQDQKPLQAAVGDWEGRCDDSLIGGTESCGRIAAILKDKRKEEKNIDPNEIFDLARPTASKRDNRSAIKRGSLGVLDTAALLPSPPFVAGQPKKNAAGHKVTVVRDESDIFGASHNNPIYLHNTIYYHEGDLEIGIADDRSKRILLNGIQGSFDAAGTVVVKGNIIIRRPIEYEPISSGITAFSKLPSLAWVALEHQNDGATPPTDAIDPEEWKKGGNIVIDACIPPNDSYEARPRQGGVGETIYDRTFMWVEERDAQGKPVIDPITGEIKKKPNYTNAADAAFIDAMLTGNAIASVAGSFFAENTFVTGHGRGGDGQGDCTNLGLKFKTSIEKTVRDEDGNESVQLVDEEDEEARQLFTEMPLEIRGVVVARNILFDRVYRGVNRGSETIVNTGRMLVNPPPGIAEFVRSLPLW